jgi:hypothetical protein
MEQLDSVPGKAVETGAEFSLWRTLPRRTGTCSRWCSGARCLMCPTKETGTEAHQEARFILINSTSKLVIFWWFASSQAFRIKVMRINSPNYFSINKWLSRASPTWQWFTQILVSISKRTGWPKNKTKKEQNYLYSLQQIGEISCLIFFNGNAFLLRVPAIEQNTRPKASTKI